MAVVADFLDQTNTDDAVMERQTKDAVVEFLVLRSVSTTWSRDR